MILDNIYILNNCIVQFILSVNTSVNYIIILGQSVKLTYNSLYLKRPNSPNHMHWQCNHQGCNLERQVYWSLCRWWWWRWRWWSASTIKIFHPSVRRMGLLLQTQDQEGSYHQNQMSWNQIRCRLHYFFLIHPPLQPLRTNLASLFCDTIHLDVPPLPLACHQCYCGGYKAHCGCWNWGGGWRTGDEK